MPLTHTLVVPVSFALCIALLTVFLCSSLSLNYLQRSQRSMQHNATRNRIEVGRGLCLEPWAPPGLHPWACIASKLLQHLSSLLWRPNGLSAPSGATVKYLESSDSCKQNALGPLMRAPDSFWLSIMPSPTPYPPWLVSKNATTCHTPEPKTGSSHGEGKREREQLLHRAAFGRKGKRVGGRKMLCMEDKTEEVQSRRPAVVNGKEMVTFSCT